MSFFTKLRLRFIKPQRTPFFNFVSNVLGTQPNDIEIYRVAFTHRSKGISDNLGNVLSYERLEFLGDSVLSTVISTYLYKEVPSGNEGYLTQMRSKVVSRKKLNEIGEQMQLVNFLDSQIPKAQFGANVHGNILEALIGAIYIDKGFKGSQEFIESKVIHPYVSIRSLENQIISYKSLLIEWFQKNKKVYKYDTFEEQTKELSTYFSVKLLVDGEIVAKARATSKKKAEEIASRRAYFVYQNQIKQ